MACSATVRFNGTATGWSTINHSRWTFETRIKFNNISNGFVFWLGTGSHRILIEAYADRTQDFGANSFNVSHNNHDGQFHTFKVTHDPANSVYHLWRDGVLLTQGSAARMAQGLSSAPVDLAIIAVVDRVSVDT